MKPLSSDRRPLVSNPDTKNPAKRRTVLMGAAAVGAGALAAGVLPVDTLVPAEPASTDKAKHDGGYRESQHVLRYYETTRI